MTSHKYCKIYLFINDKRVYKFEIVVTFISRKFKPFHVTTSKCFYSLILLPKRKEVYVRMYNMGNGF